MSRESAWSERPVPAFAEGSPDNNHRVEKPIQGFRRLSAEPLREAADQIEVERRSACSDRACSINQVHRAASKRLHCNKVFAPDEPQRLSLKWNVDRARERLRIKPLQPDQ